MMDQYEVILTRVDNSSNQQIVIEKEETLLGRGSFLSVSDKKVSRNHATLSFHEGVGNLKSIHVNPCFVKLKNGKQLVLKNGGSIDLSNGDKFSLLQDKYVFEVQIALIGKGASTPSSSPERATENGHYDENVIGDVVTCVERTCQTSLVDENSVQDKPTPKLVKILPNSHSKNSSSSPNRKRKLPAWMTTPEKSQNKKLSPAKKIKTLNLNQVTFEDTHNQDKVEDKDVPIKKLESTTSDEKLSGDTENLNVNVSLSSVVEHSTSSKCIPYQKGESILAEVKSAHKQTEENNVEISNNTDMHESDCSQSNEESSVLVDRSSDNDHDKDTSTSDQNNSEKQSNSSSGPMTTNPLRESCAYGRSCYRRNPVHFQEFSHPGDSDYVSPPPTDDDGNGDTRPECEYGLQCYRKNPLHRRQFKHTRRVTPGRAATRTKRGGKDEEDSEEDEYDLEDSFICDDETSEEEEESIDEDSEWKPSQDKKKKNSQTIDITYSESESDDVDDLVADAKNFTRNNKMWKK